MLNNIAITPGHCLDPQIAIAACRAGEVGIVDLGYRETPDAVIPVLNRLAFSAGSRAQWGVRWDTLGSPARSVESLSMFLPLRVPVLIIGGLRAPDIQPADLKPRELAHLKKKVKGLAQQILVEVNDLQTARLAIAAGCDGLIIKGHEAWWMGQSALEFYITPRILRSTKNPLLDSGRYRYEQLCGGYTGWRNWRSAMRTVLAS